MKICFWTISRHGKSNMDGLQDGHQRPGASGAGVLGCCDCVTAGPLIQDTSGRRTACHQHPALPLCTDKPSAAQFLGNVLQELPRAVWVSPPGLLLSLFFLGRPLPCCGEWGCGANLSRCANFPPLLAGISGHQAGTARAELNSKRLPKLASGSWPPTSVGREVTAE